MKKLTSVLVLAMFVLTLSAAVFAENASSIGYIEVQKVFKEYKETQKAQKELAKQEEDFKKDFDESQKKLKEAEEKGKSDAELEKMKKDLEEKLTPKRTSLLKLNEQLTVKLQQDIVKAVTKVSDKVGLSVVVDKQVIIVGGMDITDLVISELNK